MSEFGRFFKIFYLFFKSKSGGINDVFEGHHGPVTAVSCNKSVDYSNIFLTSSFDWSIKLWNMTVSFLYPSLSHLYDFYFI